MKPCTYLLNPDGHRTLRYETRIGSREMLDTLLCAHMREPLDLIPLRSIDADRELVLIRRATPGTSLNEATAYQVGGHRVLGRALICARAKDAGEMVAKCGEVAPVTAPADRAQDRIAPDQEAAMQGAEEIMASWPEITEGGRNVALRDFVYRIREHCATDAESTLALGLVFAAERCVPAYPEEEARATIRSAIKSAQNASGSKAFDALNDLALPSNDPHAKPFDPVRSPQERRQEMRSKAYGFPLADAQLPDVDTLSTPPARDWVIDKVLLAGKTALLAGFGGVAKTALSIRWGVHVALGREFDGHKVPEGIAILVLGEEDADERNRRVGAVISDMGLSPEDVRKVRDRLLIYPAQGMDVRLVQRTAQSVAATGLGDNLIAMAQERGRASGLPVRLIALDHYMMLTDGDPNDGGAATVLTTEAARVARETQAAVLLVCHMPKAAAGKSEQDQHSVFGSAFNVNNTRGTLLLVAMQPKDAKEYGIPEAERRRYVQLQIGKANAGPSDERVCWLERKVLPAFETIVLEPTALRQPEAEAEREKASATAWEAIVAFLGTEAAAGTLYTQNELQDARGRIPTRGRPLTRDAVRDAVKALRDRGVLDPKAELPADKRRDDGPQTYIRVIRDLQLLERFQ